MNRDIPSPLECPCDVTHDIIACVLALKVSEVRKRFAIPRAALRLDCSRPAAADGEPCKHCADIEKLFGSPTHVAVAAAQWQLQVWFSSCLRIIAGSLGEVIMSREVGQETPEHLPSPEVRSERFAWILA